MSSGLACSAMRFYHIASKMALHTTCGVLRPSTTSLALNRSRLATPSRAASARKASTSLSTRAGLRLLPSSSSAVGASCASVLWVTKMLAASDCRNAVTSRLHDSRLASRRMRQTACTQQAPYKAPATNAHFRFCLKSQKITYTVLAPVHLKCRPLCDVTPPLPGSLCGCTARPAVHERHQQSVKALRHHQH